MSSSAVFLSYASQDAEAVRRLADALRADGIEVWFDQNELVGGDAWDAKIRRQIADCALFLPVISATTQARLEGYFRLEWKIAAQRMQTMAEEKIFLLPIVIDDTRDSDARVPAEFKTVQWTRLPGGEASAAFRARVKRVLAGDPVPPSASAAPAAAASPVVTGADPAAKGAKFGQWMGYTWAAIGLGFGLFWASRPLWRARDAKPPAAPVAPAAAPTAAPVKVAETKLDPQRVVLTRFENLSGDPALDALVRLLEGEVMRALTPVQVARVQPVEVAGRTAGRAAAREAGAASFIVGSLLKVGDQVEISASLVLTAEGDQFGTVGPLAVNAATPRGAGLTELLERLATGVSNGVVTLMNPPTRLSAVIYNRPWPRQPVAARLTALRADAANRPEELIAGYRAMLAEAPELLKVKHDLARLLRDSGDVEAAQKLFRELLRDDRAQLAEAEVYAIVYDEAVLAGDPDRALNAARSLLEIRPRSDAITQVIACLWAQNRPRGAFVALQTWWEQFRETVPVSGRSSTEAGFYATEAFMHYMEGAPEKCLASLERLERVLDGTPYGALHWLRFVALGALGREEEQQKLVAQVAALAGSSRIEPVIFHSMGYHQAMHLGRPEVAQRWLAAAEKSWADLDHRAPLPDNLESIGIWLHLALGRPEQSLRVIERFAQRTPVHVNTIGARAIVLRALGRIAEAEADEKRLEAWESRNSRGLPDYWRARIAARAGDRERAVKLLRQAVSGGLWLGGFNSPSFDYGRSEAEFATLRGYAPYEELLKPRG